MNGTEFRSFNGFQILTKIAYPDLNRICKLTILKFVFIHCKAMKVSQNDEIQM